MAPVAAVGIGMQAADQFPVAGADGGPTRVFAKVEHAKRAKVRILRSFVPPLQPARGTADSHHGQRIVKVGAVGIAGKCSCCPLPAWVGEVRPRIGSGAIEEVVGRIERTHMLEAEIFPPGTPTIRQRRAEFARSLAARLGTATRVTASLAAVEALARFAAGFDRHSSCKKPVAAYIGALQANREALDVTSVEEEIGQRLSGALAPEFLEVRNDSARHAGHAGDDGSGESHFTVRIVADAFVGQSRVARQRAVYTALGPLMARIHALAIAAAAPGETLAER